MSIRPLTIITLLAVLMSACFYSAPDPGPATTEGNWPDRRALFEQLESKGALLLVYPESKKDLYQPLIDSLKSAGRRSFEIIAKADAEVKDSELKSLPLAIVGAFKSNRLYRRIETGLPFHFDNESFSFNHARFSGKEATLKLFPYPSPFNRDLPLLLFGANEDQALVNLVEQRNDGDWTSFFWRNWGFEVAEKGENRMIGYFNEQWEVDENLSHDFTVIKDTTVDSRYFRFVFHQIPNVDERLDTLVQHCEQSLLEIMNFLGVDGLEKKIDYHLYPSAETKGLQLFNTEPAHVDSDGGAVYAVFDPVHCGQMLSKENRIIIQQTLGQAATTALETGLAVHFAPKWHEHGAHYWTGLLYQSDNLPALSELLDNERFKEASPLVFETASGVLVEFLLEHWGKDAFLEKFPTWQPAPAELKELEPIWRAFLAKTYVQKIERKTVREIPYMKGFNFAHEGYRIHNGYGSEAARQSLVELQNLGTNAIAIVPYSYMQDAQKPSPLPLMQRAGSETDESVVASHAHAKAMNMYTMLKPQIWMRGSWPGDIMMKNEADWQQFFEYYYRWMRHYALLAEMEQMDILCVGVEFAKATIERPEDWRRLIRKLRGIYHGPITYAANWGEEFEKLSFWQEVDYIGLNCYYPLSKDKTPSEGELENGFAQIVEKIEVVSKRENKPLIFTEIGFRSTEHTWVNPHAEADGRAYDGKGQEECYRIVLEQIKDKPWCNGILWWKWPSYLDYRGGENTGFSPNGKPAEAVVSEFWR